MRGGDAELARQVILRLEAVGAPRVVFAGVGMVGAIRQQAIGVHENPAAPVGAHPVEIARGLAVSELDGGRGAELLLEEERPDPW